MVAGIIVGAFVASAGSELSFAFGPIPLIVGLVLVALFVRSIRRER